MAAIAALPTNLLREDAPLWWGGPEEQDVAETSVLLDATSVGLGMVLEQWVEQKGK